MDVILLTCHHPQNGVCKALLETRCEFTEIRECQSFSVEMLESSIELVILSFGLKFQALLPLREYLLKIISFSCCSIQAISFSLRLPARSTVADHASSYAKQKTQSKRKVRQFGNFMRVSKSTG